MNVKFFFDLAKVQPMHYSISFLATEYWTQIFVELTDPRPASSSLLLDH
jgi:hypothetical protein